MKATACFIAPVHNNKVMLQKRPDKTWGLFGGHRERGENCFACALREFKEETGLHLGKGLGMGPKLHTHMMYGPYIIFRYDANTHFKPSNRCTETLGSDWFGLQDLKSLKLVKEFKLYLPSFINHFSQSQEVPVAKSSILALATTDAIDVIASLQSSKRYDLAEVFAKEVFGKKTVAQVSPDAKLNETSMKILDEKAAEILENLKNNIKKAAEGDIEHDVLKQHVRKLIDEHLGEIVAPESPAVNNDVEEEVLEEPDMSEGADDEEDAVDPKEGA